MEEQSVNIQEEMTIEVNLEDTDEETILEDEDKPLMRSDLERIMKELDEEEKQKNEKFGGDVVGLSLPEPSTVIYWRDYAERAIYLEDEITSETVGMVNRILRWNNEDAGIPIEKRKPIKIYINSPGGLLYTSFAICDAIKASKTPVYGINLHECASGAALIFSSCHKRVAMPNAFFLFHLGSGGTFGTYRQSKAQQVDYDHKIDQMKALLKLNLNVDNPAEIDELIDGEWYLYMDVNDGSHSDARHYNLITHEYDELFGE